MTTTTNPDLLSELGNLEGIVRAASCLGSMYFDTDPNLGVTSADLADLNSEEPDRVIEESWQNVEMLEVDTALALLAKGVHYYETTVNITRADGSIDTISIPEDQRKVLANILETFATNPLLINLIFGNSFQDFVKVIGTLQTGAENLGPQFGTLTNIESQIAALRAIHIYKFGESVTGAETVEITLKVLYAVLANNAEVTIIEHEKEGKVVVNFRNVEGLQQLIRNNPFLSTFYEMGLKAANGEQIDLNSLISNAMRRFSFF